MSWTSSLATCNTSAFVALATPLADMAGLAYTATHGSYHQPNATNATVRGWERDLKRTLDPAAGGARALLFVQDYPAKRAVVAFRGTDTDLATRSGRADVCADRLLWNGASASELPPFCKTFSRSTLDYFANARDYVAEVRRAYPQYDLLLVGHSLGAGLAMLVAANATSGSGRPSPAVGFASPPWSAALRRRGGVVPSEATSRDRLFAMADMYDPVEGWAVAQGGLRGEVCRWSVEPPSTACYVCFREFSKPPKTTWDAPCSQCFHERHVFKHYLNDLLPSARPHCVSAAEASLPAVMGVTSSSDS